MASKRNLKKHLHNMVLDVVEECYSIQLYTPAKTEVTDRVIEEIVMFRNDIVEKIHQAKSKKDYPAIIEKLEQGHEDFIQKVNGLH